MKVPFPPFLFGCFTTISLADAIPPHASPNAPLVVNRATNVTYVGLERNGVDVFLGLKYAHDTSGARRFKPPVPFIPEPGSVVDATQPSLACPQQLGPWYQPLTLGNITEISEDCLGLNIVRPGVAAGNSSGSTGQKQDKHAVMLWIHGGSFWVGSNTEPTHQPDALVLESVKAGHPVIHVGINYRLGFFGFGQSNSLRKERSENAGLRDQRLAIEWVRDNIAHFGGDPNRITIFGQSSGGLAVGIQLLAYGGTQPLPYQQGICESQALEPGITGNFTIDAMTKVANYTGCLADSVHTPDTISCLRQKDTQTLLNASLDTYVGDIYHNIGDIWLPSVDGDFLPAPPSQLLSEGKFGNATYLFGWTQGDVNFFTDFSIATPNDSFNFIQGYLPVVPPPAVQVLLDLYPVSEFVPPNGTHLTAEFFRTARIFRDILMVCEPLYFAEHLYAKTRNTASAYLYNWNQTILEPIIEQIYNVSKIGVVHTSEFAYTYANFSHWNQSGWYLVPSESDYELQVHASHSWATFADTGVPSAAGSGSLSAWSPAFYDVDEGNANIFVIGGPNERLSALDGVNSTEEIRAQRLRERCGLINSENYIKWLQF